MTFHWFKYERKKKRKKEGKCIYLINKIVQKDITEHLFFVRNVFFLLFFHIFLAFIHHNYICLNTLSCWKDDGNCEQDALLDNFCRFGIFNQYELVKRIHESQEFSHFQEKEWSEQRSCRPAKVPLANLSVKSECLWIHKLPANVNSFICNDIEFRILLTAGKGHGKGSSKFEFAAMSA